MIFRVALLFLIGGPVGLGAVPHGTAAQGTTGAAGTVLARFEDARALAVDPVGRLYVADAGPDVVVVLGPDGSRQQVLGGAGARAGEFDTPSDVDPTNGQMLLVADSYNGRVQRFSEEGQYLGSLPIGRGDRAGVQGWVFDETRGGAAVQGDGRPIAVASGNEGTIFVLDERDEVLLKWNDLGRPTRIVGGLSQQKDRLEEPVALALGERGRLYVADAGQEAVLVYDSFGTFVRTLPTPPLPKVRAVTVPRGRLWIACSDRVLVWDRSEGLVAERPVDLAEPLVDVARYEDDVYLLTATRLRRRARW